MTKLPIRLDLKMEDAAAVALVGLQLSAHLLKTAPLPRAALFCATSLMSLYLLTREKDRDARDPVVVAYETEWGPDRGAPYEPAEPPRRRLPAKALKFLAAVV